MRITTFDPIVITSKSDDIVKLFEDLGFERRHHNTEVDDRHSIRMKNEDGFHVDVVQNDELQKDNMVIRMNVDNFEEARDILLAHGFKESPRFLDLKSAKAVGMISPSGFVIGLVEHKKDHD